jgi:GxxExxY protein
MDRQDDQDGRWGQSAPPESRGSGDRHDGDGRPLKHEGITRAIIGCAFEVSNELGAGFLESVYEKALLHLLRGRGLTVAAQAPIRVTFRGQCVGEFLADLLVDGKVIVELKAAKTLAPEHQAQVINYLNATGIEVGLLFNFGNLRLEYRRLTRTPGVAQHPPQPPPPSCPSM